MTAAKTDPIRIFSTIITPYTPDGQIDYPSLGKLISLIAQSGCDGLFAVCQSSEMFFLSDEEKLELARFCIRLCHDLGMDCVISGHTHDDPADQLRYLQQAEELGADALVLVLNRFADENEDDDILIARMEALLSQLKTEKLGMYECPYPYKRLLTPKILDYMKRSGRFTFIKDTCCDADMIRQRLLQLRGSGIGLYNANAATLVERLLDGAAGYSGVMMNFFPELFGLLKRYLPDHVLTEGLSEDYEPGMAQIIGEFISQASVFECQGYPRNAKWYLKNRGIIATDLMRNGQPPLPSSRQKELLAFSNTVNRALAQFGPSSQPEAIFPEGRWFPSCHASSVLPLEDGTVLAAWFGGSYEKCPDVGIWLARRVNGIWEDPVQVAKAEQTAHWNPVLFSTNEGVRLVYKVGATIPGWKSRTKLSADGGKTWSEEVCYPEPHAACGPVRSKPLRMSNGQLLAPNSDESTDRWFPLVDVSDDEGHAFSLLSRIPMNLTDPARPDYISGDGAIQPTLWESEPGHIHALLRTTCGYIFRSDSTDYGKTWCQAYNTGLPNNHSGIDIVRHGDTLYLALNPISGLWAARTPLVIYRSRDNGVTFTPFITLADRLTDPRTGDTAEFSYPSLAIADDVLYVTHTSMRRQILFHKIPLSETSR